MDKQILDDYIQSIKSQYDAYYTGFAMHPEEGREAKINDELTKIQEDLLQIDNALIHAGEQVYNLMINTILRLNNIYAGIMTEKERYQDMQMLCNKYNDYDNVKLLEEADFKGSFSYKDGDFSPMINKEKNVKLYVIDVYGNGYEGNKYVYKDYIYSNKVLDTSKRDNMIDNKDTSYYEYSRITVNNIEDACITDFNKDNKEAQCTITFQAEELINEIEIGSDDSDIIITKISYSLDGVDFIDLSVPYITINNKLDSYENYGYIYGSGKIIFPCRVQLFKITFQSNGYKNDTIAYQKTLISESYYYDETGISVNPDPVETYEVDEVTTIVKSAQRHVIKINEVKAYLYQYTQKCKMQSVELVGSEVYAISLFANVYVPNGLTDDSVKFILTVNGYDFEVVPINSHLNGTKIIRFSTGNSSNPYTERIGEKIKSAYLTVSFTNETRLAPRINNIKILLGGEL
jgi:hypothetical protein